MADDELVLYLHATVEQVAFEIDMFNAETRAQLALIANRFAALFANDWQGEVAAAFNAATTEWEGGAEQVAEALTVVADRLREAVDRMRDITDGILRRV